MKIIACKSGGMSLNYFTRRLGIILVFVFTILFSFGCSSSGGGSGDDTSPNAIVGFTEDPVADAGVDRIGRVAQDVSTPLTQEILYLDGSSSYGYEYEWEIISKPTTTAQFVFSSPNTKTTGVYGDTAGVYEIKLTVKNALKVSVEDNVTVTLLEDDDGDGIINVDDLDVDGDGFLNTNDLFPTNIVAHGDFNDDNVSNYATADVDGDGVVDSEDDFPLDANRSTLTSYIESLETNTTFNANDGISIAEETGPLPLMITGTIYSSYDGDFRPDLDYYKASFTEGVYSILLKEHNSSMQPIISVVNGSGQSVSSTGTDISAVGYALLSILIPSDGNYSIMVTDASGTSAIDWSYTIKAFADSDMDGVSDDFEIAVDSNNHIGDGDSDGIGDFLEIYYTYDANLSDVDGDGIPNWWDYDSDNDGLADYIEYYTSSEKPNMTVAGLAILNDIDQDGIPNFLDTDSDGNGVLDKDEVGTDFTNPLDTDGDSVPDYLDEDNDNDGIKDINEATLSEMNTAIALAGESRSFATSVMIESLTNDTFNVKNVCMDDTNVTVTLLNVASDAEVLLTFKGLNDSINQTAIVDSNGSANFSCPKDIESGLVEFFVTVDNSEKTLSEDLLFVEPGTPIVKSAIYNPFDETIAITGSNLDSDLTVILNNKSYSYNNYYGSSSEFTFSTYETLESGNLYLTNSAGSSNQVWTSITHEVNVNVVVPDTTIDVTSLELSVDDVTYRPNSDGTLTYPVSAYSSALITAFLEDTSQSVEDPDYIPYLYAVALKNETQITLDTNSTVMAMIWSGLGVGSMIDDSNLSSVMEDISNLQAVQDFKVVLKEELIKDKKVLISPSAAYTTASQQALLASAELLDEKLSSGEYVSRSVSRGLFGDAATVKPSIADGISVYERGDTGDLNIYNDTQMYLSARVTDMKGNLLQDHVSSYFSSNLVGPQGYGLLFWASTTELNLPFGQNCNVEIVTPGVDTEYEPKISALSSTNPSTRAVFKYLAFRTLVERVTWPVLAEIFGDYMDKHTFINIIYVYAPALVDAVVIDISKGDNTAAAKRMIDLLWQDFFSQPPGPVTTAIAKKVLGEKIENMVQEFAQELVKKVAKKIGMKTVPVLGQISAAYEIAGHLNNGLNAAGAVYDLNTKDSIINFAVTFPVTVTSISPSKIIPDDSNRVIKIDGTGFSAIKEHFYYLSGTLPEISVIDNDGNVIVLSPNYINSDGTSMNVEIPGTFLNKDVEGPLDVIVNHPIFSTDGEIERLAAIEIVSDVTLTSVDPSSGATAVKVTLYGSGFSPEVSNNEVTFDGAKVLIVSASQDTLSIMVPPSLDPGDYSIIARANHSDEWTDWSNSVTYTVESGNVNITVCDDGGLKDDAFALYIDSKFIGSMYASDASYCATYTPNLVVGSHTAMLQGIEAPDDVGTYSIDFGGLSVSGASLSGSDLTPGVVKNYTFEVNSAQSRVYERSLLTQPYNPQEMIEEE